MKKPRVWKILWLMNCGSQSQSSYNRAFLFLLTKKGHSFERMYFFERLRLLRAYFLVYLRSEVCCGNRFSNETLHIQIWKHLPEFLVIDFKGG